VKNKKLKGSTCEIFETFDD